MAVSIPLLPPPPTKALRYSALLLLFIVTLTVLQDYLQAQRNGYRFFLNESLLFKTFWALFLPIAALLVRHWAKLPARPKRLPLAAQVALFTGTATLLHLLLFPLCITLLSALLLNHTYAFYQTLSYTIAEDIYKYILVYGAIAWWWLHGKRAPAAPAISALQPAHQPLLQLLVDNGRQKTAIATEAIVCISAASPYAAIHTMGQKFLHSATLKALAGQLDNALFIRVHKSAIVNIRQVQGYTSRLNGDYDIQMANGQTIRLSRRYVAAFKHALAHR
jgi:hypothetical protein